MHPLGRPCPPPSRDAHWRDSRHPPRPHTRCAEIAAPTTRESIATDVTRSMEGKASSSHPPSPRLRRRYRTPSLPPLLHTLANMSAATSVASSSPRPLSSPVVPPPLVVIRNPAPPPVMGSGSSKTTTADGLNNPHALLRTDIEIGGDDVVPQFLPKVGRRRRRFQVPVRCINEQRG
jgi:hypothetical protein